MADTGARWMAAKATSARASCGEGGQASRGGKGAARSGSTGGSMRAGAARTRRHTGSMSTAAVTASGQCRSSHDATTVPNEWPTTHARAMPTHRSAVATASAVASGPRGSGSPMRSAMCGSCSGVVWGTARVAAASRCVLGDLRCHSPRRQGWEGPRGALLSAKTGSRTAAAPPRCRAGSTRRPRLPPHLPPPL